MSESLTGPQRAALEAVARLSDAVPERGERAVTPRQVARVLWPDSPAWERRTRGRRTGTQSGAVGGTMPMKAATLLWRLRERGLVEKVAGESSEWFVTPLGRRVLAGTDVPRPKPVKAPVPVVERRLKSNRKPTRKPGR